MNTAGNKSANEGTGRLRAVIDLVKEINKDGVIRE
jgi:hypothetical protein